MESSRGGIGNRIRDPFVRILPPPAWRLPVLFLAGFFVGLVGLVAHVSRATSYLSDDPATCVNCHVMAPEYVTWANSAHRRAATCNDCHVPHDNYLRHYAFKASDGARHAFMFTFRLEPQVIRIHPAGQRVVQQNCVRCHTGALQATGLAAVRGDDTQGADGLRCWDCHRETPHGSVRGLSAVPYEHVPLPGPASPRWLRDAMDRGPPIPDPGAPRPNRDR
jgi:cytochrome c nitrite reductase small subunit